LCFKIKVSGELGDARKNLEIESGESVVKPDNYLNESESSKRKRLK